MNARQAFLTFNDAKMSVERRKTYGSVEPWAADSVRHKNST